MIATSAAIHQERIDHWTRQLPSGQALRLQPPQQVRRQPQLVRRRRRRETRHCQLGNQAGCQRVQRARGPDPRRISNAVHSRAPFIGQ